MCSECDPNCASACTTAGAGLCDTACNSGYTLNTATYKCQGN